MDSKTRQLLAQLAEKNSTEAARIIDFYQKNPDINTEGEIFDGHYLDKVTIDDIYPDQEKFFIGITSENGQRYIAIYNVATGNPFKGAESDVVNKIIELVEQEYIPCFDLSCLPESEISNYMTFDELDLMDVAERIISTVADRSKTHEHDLVGASFGYSN